MSPSTATSCDGYIFSFECGPVYSKYQHWLETHHEQCIGAIVAYIGFIYFGQKLMANRKAIGLDRLLFLWNLSLATFSIFGAYRFWEESVHLYIGGGYQRLLCVNSVDRIRSFWTFAFAISKIVEFGDTVFLILRKRPVIFLHWYHHITVLLFTWHACAQQAAFGRLFMLMNYTVHSIMYTYYALASIGIRAPRIVSMSITTMQILQMVGGLAAVLYVRSQLLTGNACDVRQEIITSGLLMYGSYFILFVKFFINAYVFKKKRHNCKVTISCTSTSTRNFTNSSSSTSSSSSSTSARQSPSSGDKSHDSNYNFLGCNGGVNGKSKCL